MNAPEKILIVKGCAGLGNRLSTIGWALDYAIRSRRKICVDWTDGMYGNRGENIFDKYFDIMGVESRAIQDIDLKNVHEKSVFPSIWKKHLRDRFWDVYADLERIPRFERAWIRLSTFNRWCVSNRWKLKERTKTFFSLWPSLSLKQGLWSAQLHEYPDDLDHDVVVGADYCPQFSREIFLKHIRIKKDILADLAVKAKTCGIDADTLGIHVRQTDWSWAPGLDLLIIKLKKLGSEVPKKIFVATDSQEALDRLKSVVPAVISLEKLLPKTVEGGIHHWSYHQDDGRLAEQMFFEGLTDMYMLSRCGKFWYQGGSTFSEFARVWAIESQDSIDWNHIE